MTLRRLRIRLALAFAGITFALLVVPVLLVHASAAAGIREDLADEARAEMEEVQLAWSLGVERVSPTWQVVIEAENQYTVPFDRELAVEPPLFRLLRDSGAEPSFGTFANGDEEYLAYVLPRTETEGFVTVVPTSARDDRIASLRWRLGLLGIGLVTIAGFSAWWLAGRALGPARRAVAEQQGFLADAAHEMRTPLAVILASSSQALARPREQTEYVRSLSEIRSAAERASAGVNELLDLVRFDSGQAIPRTAPLRLDLLAEEVAASVRPDDGEVHATPAAPVVVDADMPLIRQAIDNLVRNAVRRAERVDLVAAVDGRDGVLDVLDDGPGFDPAVLPRVFDRYQRGDRRGEVGMGLAIVKAIVTAHGGTVEAANRPEGGARVRVRIPLSTGLLRP